MSLDLQKFKKVRAERDQVKDEVIRVSRKGQPKEFIDQICQQFTEHKAKEVTLSSLGSAIAKTCTIAEAVKHRVPGVHQLNEIKTIVLEDAYEPLEEFKGELKNTSVSRKLTCFQIVLSLQPPADIKMPGYQVPLPTSEVNPSLGPDDYDLP
jgi:DNA-binding protein